MIIDLPLQKTRTRLLGPVTAKLVDFALLDGNPDTGKLGFVCQLVFWRSQGCFPDEEADIAPAVIAHLARQIDVPFGAIEGYAFRGRSSRRHRQLILNHLAAGEFDEAAEKRFRTWLLTDVLPREPGSAAVEAEIASWFGAELVIRPASYRLDRLIRSIRAAHDDGVLAAVTAGFDDGVRARLDGLLTDDGTGAAYTRLSADPGRVSLDGLLTKIDKLELMRAVGLPADLLSAFHADLIKRFRRRASVETAWDLRRHSTRIRLPLLVDRRPKWDPVSFSRK